MPRLFRFKSFIISSSLLTKFKLKQLIFLLVFALNFLSFVVFVIYETRTKTVENKNEESEIKKDFSPLKNQQQPDLKYLLKDRIENEGEFHGQDWHDENQIYERTQNCDTYFDMLEASFMMNKSIISKHEENNLNNKINLAFTHMLHHQVAIYEIFLALYFRPNNFYCIHVDVKSSDLIRKTVENLVKCYSNKITTGKIFVLDKKESLDVS